MSNVILEVTEKNFTAWSSFNQLVFVVDALKYNRLDQSHKDLKDCFEILSVRNPKPAPPWNKSVLVYYSEKNVEVIKCNAHSSLRNRFLNFKIYSCKYQNDKFAHIRQRERE